MTRSTIVRTSGWALLLGLLCWMGWNLRGYAFHPGEVPFYQERIGRMPEGWGGLLRIHVAGGVLCLGMAPLLFSRWLGRIQGLHTVAGTLYGIGALVALPTAVPLSWTADGGAWGRAGFLVTTGWAVIATVLAFVRLYQGRIESHVRWVWRSMAMMAGALTFRLLYLTGYLVGVDYAWNYPLSTWLSTLINFTLVELYLRRRSLTPPLRKIQHENLYPPSSPRPELHLATGRRLRSSS